MALGLFVILFCAQYLPPKQSGQYPPQQSGQYPPQQSGQYPPQQSGQYPHQGSGQYLPQQSIGQYPPQTQQGSGQYGQHSGAPPRPASHQQIAAYKQLLQTTIQQKSLQAMIPPNSPSLDQYAHRALSQTDQVCARMRVPREIGQDLVKLALFDIILYIDNSGSMIFDEGGDRVVELKGIINAIVYAATLFDDDGISIRFMNDWPSNPAIDGVDMRRLDRIQNEQMVEHIISKVQYVGITPLGTELKNKVIDPLVLGPARARQLRKPVLVITITDGQPAGEPVTAIYESIRYASNELSRMPQYGPGAISFQFAQVGNNQQAREFLAKLDSDPQQAKVLLGSIDSSYDTKDESASQPPGAPGYGAPAPGPYSGSNTYAQQPYPPQQGFYGGPPQQNYGLPPPQQGYESQNYGQQEYRQSPQPGYAQPPPQQYWGQQLPPQGYSSNQQSNYSAPPPPPRYR
ncbi:MAG: hypothetical protein Q9216_003121 [Gyalolechia sp. 2 TL-2023]